ncbi:hypothetical protein TNCV_148421 [Trichonephila clavipes]|nr:hypothetical protein TNCV_148421 [Trichonephila clavipes]
MYIESEKDCFLYAKKKWLVEYYATDWEGNEVYASKHGVCYFAKCLKTSNEYYAKKNDYDEFYFSDKFAKVGKTFEIYALANNGKEIYPKNNAGKEIYAKNYLDEYYAKDENLNQYYARDENGNYYFAKNEFGEEIYARNSNGSFSDQLPITQQDMARNFYSIDKNGKELYDKIAGKEIVVFDQDNFPRYAKNENGSERYPLDAEGKPYMANNGIHTFYAKDKDGNEFYSEYRIAVDLTTLHPILAKTNMGFQYYPQIEGEEFTPLRESGQTIGCLGKACKNAFPRTIPGYHAPQGGAPHTLRNTALNGYVVYPKNVFNRSMYPTENSNEYYIYDTRKRQFIFGTDEYGIEMYAIDENSNEIYPPDFSFIIDRYAKDKQGYIIYPKDEYNNEYYLNITLENKKVRNYANNQYPEQDYIERILNNKYIISLGYPRDEFNNEYTPIGMIEELEYPQTTDGYIIVPKIFK